MSFFLIFFLAILSQCSDSNYCITLKSTTSVLVSRKVLLALYLTTFHACRAQWNIVRIVPCWLELHHVRLCSISRNVSSDYECICLKVFWRACYFGLCFEGHYILRRLRQWAVSLMEYILFVCFIWSSYPQTFSNFQDKFEFHPVLRNIWSLRKSSLYHLQFLNIIFSDLSMWRN